jgi:hypothetical protein
MLTSEQIDEMRRKEHEASRRYAAKRFRLRLKDVAGYHGGICYDTCWVRTEEAAKKVAKSVGGDTANGGYFDGMPLGGMYEQDWSDGTRVWRVQC